MQPWSICIRVPTRVIVIAGCALLTPLVVLAQIVVDFENLPAGTTVTDQYIGQFVRFSSAFLAADPAARSGTRVLRTINPAAEVFTPIPLRISFVKPQARVKLFASSPGSPRNGTLRAFDASDAVVAQDGPKLVAADTFTTMFEVVVKGPRIARAELQLENAAHYAIDDLEFDTSATSTPEPPRVVEMRQPSPKDNPAVTGRFPSAFRIGKPPAGLTTGKPSDPEEEEAEERFDFESAPSVERELAPGATARLSTKVPGAVGLAGSVRWIGTAAALPVTLTLNGSTLGFGKPYALGADRGGADVGGMAKTAGSVRLSVTNTSKVRVKVLLTLGIARTPVK